MGHDSQGNGDQVWANRPKCHLALMIVMIVIRMFRVANQAVCKDTFCHFCCFEFDMSTQCKVADSHFCAVLGGCIDARVCVISMAFGQSSRQHFAKNGFLACLYMTARAMVI